MAAGGRDLGEVGHDSWYSAEEIRRYSEFLTGDSSRDQRNFRALLATVSDTIGEVEIERLLRKLLDHTLAATGAERALLLLGEPGEELFVRLARDRQGRDLVPIPPHSRTIPNQVVESGQPVLRRVDSEGETLSISHSIAAMRLRQVMCAPLRARGRTLGALYVDSTMRGPPLSPADLMLFNAQAGLLGMALERHRFMRQTLEVQAVRSQLRLARKIQASLLPQSPHRLGVLDLAGISDPSDRVGGDYFDYFGLDNGRVALTIGDVSGHGVGPALMMANARAMLRSMIMLRGSLGGIYGLMNRALSRELSAGMFVSLFAAIHDPARERLEFQNAGLNAPLLYDPRTREFRPIESNAPALGVIEDISAGPCPTVRVTPGELLVCYTDGVTEARDADGGFYGEERLREAIERSARASDAPSEMVPALRRDLDAFVGGRPASDDVTIMIARFGTPGGH